MHFLARITVAILATLHLGVIAATLANTAPDAKARKWAETLHAAAGESGGLVVHIGDVGVKTAALRTCERYHVQGLATDAARVQAAREAIRALGVYGPVSVGQYDGKRLPYIDELVNLVIVAGAEWRVAGEEIARVLAPRGVVVMPKGTKLKLPGLSPLATRLPRRSRQAKTGHSPLDGEWIALHKQVPSEIDEWTHYLYDPSNNTVAKDERIAPPRGVRWHAGPLWTRHHDRMASISSVVSAGGRLFTIMDEGPRHSPLLPSDWKLIARDAFNGTLLWKRDIPDWANRVYPFKSGPAKVPRRLVAVGDRVYVTLGIMAPVSELDAATGETLRTFKQTAGTEEILAGNDYLVAVADPRPPKPYSPIVERDGQKVAEKLGTERDRAIFEGRWDEEEQAIVLVNLSDGRERWRHTAKVAPLSVAVSEGNVVYHNGGAIECLELASGKPRWKSAPIPRRKTLFQSTGVTLVLYEDLVLFTGDDGKITVLDVKDGKQIWAGDFPMSGHYCPQDLLVAGGLVWGGPEQHNRGPITGMDPRTGEAKLTIPCEHESYWFHQRCYRSRATERYLIRPVTGTEFVDIEKRQWHLHHWFRSVCLFGFTPANGMVYQTPHPCGCFPEAKLIGFNALSAQSALDSGTKPQTRLEKGPAYGSLLGPKPAPQTWPTYRHDAARSGYTPMAIAGSPRQAWRRELGGKLSRLTAANGKVFVANINSHVLHALSMKTGEPVWAFTAGGRIDSPPTIHGGRVYFGSHDGYVYCLRTKDGELVWRFHAAPRRAVLVADDQPESVWPVHGSVLVRDDTVYAVAGRSMYLDGGVWLVRLNATTGELRGEVNHDNRIPGTEQDLMTKHGHLTMPVALPDILSCDGESLYMRSQSFNLEGRRGVVTPQMPRSDRTGTRALGADQAGTGRHIFCPSGFLDDTWFHRSYWIYGRHFPGGAGGWPVAGNYTPAARIMSCDEDKVYGYGRKSDMYQWRTPLAYHLYCADRTLKKLPPKKKAPPKAQAKGKKKRPAPVPRTHEIVFNWTTELPVHARAMVLARDTLFLAGPPAVADEVRAFEEWGGAASGKQLVAQAEALAGKRGAKLVAVSKKDGNKLTETNLPAPPIFDGMIAAGGRLYLAAIDGSVVCMGEGE